MYFWKLASFINIYNNIKKKIKIYRTISPKVYVLKDE